MEQEERDTELAVKTLLLAAWFMTVSCATITHFDSLHKIMFPPGWSVNAMDQFDDSLAKLMKSATDSLCGKG